MPYPLAAAKNHIMPSQQVEPIPPEFVSCEIGTIDKYTLPVVLNRTVKSTNFLFGSTIKNGEVIQTIDSAVLQEDSKTIHFMLFIGAESGDSLTWEYSKTSGTILDLETSAPLDDMAAQSVTNTVSISSLLTDLISYWQLTDANGTKSALNRKDFHSTNTLIDTGITPSDLGLLGNGVLFDPASPTKLSINDNVALSVGDIDFTFAIWVKLVSKDSSQFFGAKGTATSNAGLAWYLAYAISPDHFKFDVSSGSAQGAIEASTLGSPQINTDYLIVGWHDHVANKVYIQVNNGVVDSADFSGGCHDEAGPFAINNYFALTTAYGSFIGSGAGFWKKVLSDAERTALYNSGNGLLYPFNGEKLRGQIVFDGNSMTDPSYSPFSPMTYALLSGTWRFYNFGVISQTTAMMIEDQDTEVLPVYDSTLKRNILIFWEVTNSLNQGVDRATSQADMITYCQAARAAGFKVVVLTMPDRNNASQPETFQADRAAINAYIVANWSTFADALADIAALTHIGAVGDADNLTYFDALKVHPTVAAYDLICPVVVAAINTL